MRINLQKTLDLVTFTEEILNEKLHFLCSVRAFRAYVSNKVFFSWNLDQENWAKVLTGILHLDTYLLV